jgi:pyridoxine 5-phosphate synthase
VEAAARTGADRIELYTEAYASAFGTDRERAVLDTYSAAASRAQALGLGVNAGHDLNLRNLGPFLAAVPDVLEVSIGHAFVCEAFDHTLEGTVARYLAIVGAPAHEPVQPRT